MITGIDHVAITVADMRATCDFYVRLLGARVEKEYVLNGRPGVSRMAIGGAMFNVHQQDNGVDLVARTPTPGSVDICFRWSGPIETAVARLAQHDVAIIEGPAPRTTNDGTPSQSVYFNDIDGNLIELMTTD
jgi:catechol 2,3-dioxygenase-like lactoylglutathione lyase family enzyme